VTNLILLNKNHSVSNKVLCETDIIKIVACLIDKIFAMFSGCVFQQTVGIQMGMSTLLVDLFLYFTRHTSYRFLKKKRKKTRPILSRSALAI
jgi:hypothetical protein